MGSALMQARHLDAAIRTGRAAFDHELHALRLPAATIRVHPSAMLRMPVASTAITSVGYDAGTQQLEIEFRTGRVYRYRGVPAGVHAFLMRTRSKGGFVSRMIDGHYAHEDITPAPPAQDLLSALEASIHHHADE